MIDRPEKPVGIPMVGDGKLADYERWINCCDLCEHSNDKFGCVRLGIVEYGGNGNKYGFPRVPGGCGSWSAISLKDCQHE